MDSLSKRHSSLKRKKRSIVKFLKNLEKSFEEAFNHVENSSVPVTRTIL